MVISSVAELMDGSLVDTLDMVYEKFCWPAKKLSRGRVLEGMKFAYKEKETDSIAWGVYPCAMQATRSSACPVLMLKSLDPNVCGNIGAE